MAQTFLLCNITDISELLKISTVTNHNENSHLTRSDQIFWGKHRWNLISSWESGLLIQCRKSQWLICVVEKPMHERKSPWLYYPLEYWRLTSITYKFSMYLKQNKFHVHYKDKVVHTAEQSDRLYCQNHIKYVNNVCGHSAEFLRS